MAVTSSAPIDIGDLVTEFGGSTPHSLTEYYRGGSLVPNTTTNASVPASGAISLTDFFGASATSGTDDRTLTIGSGSFGGFITGYGFASTATGFPVGSISSNTIGFSGFNVTIEAVYFLINQIFFRASTNPGNSGWTSMTVGSTTFNRTDANYVSGSIATWSWSSSNVIGTSGTQTVSWQE
tara:strand:+ start:5941 stop:6483 length:543 start_codon:yes stop_codon:yes gene_type:complete